MEALNPGGYGIQCSWSASGGNESHSFFINIFQLISTPTFSEELALAERFLNEGVYIRPGQVFYCAEPGWFRIIFATDPSQLQIGK